MSAEEKLISFGIVADLQYCNASPFKNRYYKNSIAKLKKVITHFNDRELDFVVNLGDMIDREWESYDKVLPLFDHFIAPVYQVLGNHDYEVSDNKKEDVPSKIGTDQYYSFLYKNWRFIILDGNEVSTFANLPGTPNNIQAEKWLHKMKEDQKINGNFYNGGIGKVQISWLKTALDNAAEKNEKVIIFCHYPLYPPDKHNLLNNEELLSLLKNYKGVKLWLNGHNHKGNYGLFEDIHFVNVKGMVEGEDDMAWSIVKIFENRIEITGYGNEISARLIF